MKNSERRTFQSVADDAGADGYEYVRLGKHHVVDFLFGKRRVRTFLPKTPSDHRALKNCVAQLKHKANGDIQ